MTSLDQLAQKLRDANKENKPMSLQWMAEQWWHDATWLRTKATHHNGGPRVGARVAGGIAGRMRRAKLLVLCDGNGPRAYKLLTDKTHD